MKLVCAVLMALLVFGANAAAQDASLQSNLAEAADPFFAEAVDPQQQGPTGVTNHWATGEACVAAVDAPFYTPEPSKVACPAVRTKGEIRRPLGKNMCVLMTLPKEMGGKGWVKQLASEPYIWQGLSSKLIRHANCCNDVFDAIPIPDPPGPKGDTGPAGPQGPAGRDGKDGISCWDINQNGRPDPNEDSNGDGQVNVLDCQGEKGEPGRNAEAPAPKPDGPSRFGITFGAGGFSSAGMSEVVGGFFNRDACDIKGSMVDFGIAWRPSEEASWFVRAGVSTRSISGTTGDTCANCPGYEVAWSTRKVRASGPYAEAVKLFTFGPFQNDGFKPMVQLGAGMGKVSGRAMRYEGPIGGTPTMMEEVHAKEVFGMSWIPVVEGHAGFGGFTAKKRFAWTAGVGVGTLGKSAKGTGTLFF